MICEDINGLTAVVKNSLDNINHDFSVLTEEIEKMRRVVERVGRTEKHLFG